MYQKVVKSGSLVEVYEYTRTPSGCGSLPLARRPREKRIRPRTEANIRYCRNSFKRLVRANLSKTNPPFLLTLTFRDVVDIGPGYKAFTAFGVRLRRSFGPGIRYIAVPEFQKRGAVHFHALIWGIPESVGLAERKNRTLATLWGEGFLDLIQTDGNARISTYLAKYMAKGMHDDRLIGKRAYTASRNVLRPISINNLWPVARDILFEDWGFSPVDNPIDEIREYDTVHLGRCVYKQYLLKT